MKDHPDPGHPQHPRPHSLSHTQTAPLAPTTRWPRPQRAFTFLIISRHSKATASVEAAHRVNCARAAGVTIVLPPPPLTAAPAVRGTQQQDAHPHRLPELPGGQGHTDRQTDRQPGGQAEGWPSPRVTQLGCTWTETPPEARGSHQNWTKGHLVDGSCPLPW